MMTNSELRNALRFFMCLSTVTVTMAVLLAFEVLRLRDVIGGVI